MIQADSWMSDLVARLRDSFGDRLLFAGLQGSYRRGEAKESSDIDTVVILDTVTLADLDAYRGIVRDLPEGEKACGFLSGKAEIAAWPAYDRFALVMDTKSYYGELEPLAPMGRPADIREGLRIAAGNLYHILVHSWLYAESSSRPAILADALKSAKFLLVALANLKASGHGEVLAPWTLPPATRGKAILTLAASLPCTFSDEELARHFAEMIGWSGEMLRAMREFA